MKYTDKELAKEYEDKELNVVDSEYGKFAITEAVLYGLRKGRELEAENSPFLPQIIEALGWQGGTLHQVLDEVKRLKANEKEVLDLHCETLGFAEWIGFYGYTWSEADDCYCGRDGLISIVDLYRKFKNRVR